MAVTPIVFTELVRGTVKPFENFNATEDADKLKKAVTGPGTDEYAVVEIITRRSNMQLQEVQGAYQEKFKEGCQWRLFEDFAEPIEWRMRMLISSRMKTVPERDAEYLQWALYGAGTDEMALFEVFGTRSREELKAIYPYFTTTERFHSFLKDDLEESPFRTFLEYFMDPPLKESSLEADIEYLREFTCDKLARLFASRDLQRMQDVFREWEKTAGGTLEDIVVKRVIYGGVVAKRHKTDYYNALSACISMGKNVHRYFAQRIYEAVHGPSTNDTQLIRVITSRCEVDMVQIKKEFEKEYGMNLAYAVEDDTSGDYRTCLLMLITE